MKYWRIIISVFLSFSVLFTVFYGGKMISNQKEYLHAKPYKGVITLWHIETFEGGYGSRKQFLLDVASSFEKQNQGVLVMVISHTLESANKAIQDQNYPDLISYGTGFNCTNFKAINFDKPCNSASVGKKSYAYPWCKGGYVLISKLGQDPLDNKDLGSERVIISVNQTTLPTLALTLSGYTAENVQTLPPKEAYLEFINTKANYLVGTQRDVVRLSNLGLNYSIIPLAGYNDLNQYMSICSNDVNKSVYAEKYLKFLLSESVQKKLSKICMLSNFYTTEYDVEFLNELQTQKESLTISAFSSIDLIKELGELGLNSLKGDSQSLDKIKNVLISP